VFACVLYIYDHPVFTIILPIGCIIIPFYKYRKMRLGIVEGEEGRIGNLGLADENYCI